MKNNLLNLVKKLSTFWAFYKTDDTIFTGIAAVATIIVAILLSLKEYIFTGIIVLVLFFFFVIYSFLRYQDYKRKQVGLNLTNPAPNSTQDNRQSSKPTISKRRKIVVAVVGCVVIYLANRYVNPPPPPPETTLPTIR